VTNYVRDPNTGDILQTVDVVSNGANRVTAMTYNRFGQLATVTPSGAQPTALTYDQLGRPLGSTGIGANPPGAPKALQSNNATNGVPTTATNHVFTWGAPDSDSGIAGYSYAFDQAPDETIDTTAATATWTNVAVGTHTFQVMAKANNGLWGEPAVFNLIVQPLTGYALWRTQQFSPEEAANDSISGPTADPDGDGSPNLLKYALGMAAKSPSMTGLPVLTVPGNFLVFEFARNLNATDVKYEVQGSTDLATWTTLAGREAGGSTWTIDVGGTTVSDASGSVSVTDGSAPISNTGRRFLRLKVSLTQ
jgi:YD repeat-containing protein